MSSTPREAAWTTGPCYRPPARPAAWAGRFGSFTRRSRGAAGRLGVARGAGRGAGGWWWWPAPGNKGTFSAFPRSSPSWRTAACNSGNPRKTEVRAGGQRLGCWPGEWGWGSNLSTRSPSPFVTVATTGLLKLLQMLGLLLGCGLPVVGAKEKATQRKGEASVTPTPPTPAPPKLDLLLLGPCAGGGGREDVRLPAELSSSF